MKPITRQDTGLLPAIIELDDLSPKAFIDYYNSHSEERVGLLKTAGAVKYTGVQIASTEDFQQIVDAVSSKFLSYIDGNSPRTKLSGNVYTSTEYDPAQRITMHNELSYSAKWPGKIFFSCLFPAATGGETLLADSRRILENINPSIVAEVRARGICYIRNLHGGQGMGPSWQDTFESSDKAVVESYCRSYQIDHQWGHRDSLKLLQRSKGILTHRLTGEEVWFNQIDQFHPSHLGDEMYETLELLYESPENFPMYVSFGDGNEISTELIKEVLDSIDEITVAPQWQTNQFLVVDNELVSHGRNSFTGDRRVLVAMCE
jgi:hypothetical protein